MNTLMIPENREQIAKNYDSFESSQIIGAIFNPKIVEQKLHFDPEINKERLMLNGQHFGEILGIRYEHVANYLIKYCKEGETIIKVRNDNGYLSWWLTPDGVFEFIIHSRVKRCIPLKEYIVTKSSEIIKDLLSNM